MTGTNGAKPELPRQGAGRGPRLELWLISGACVFPSLVTWTYFVALGRSQSLWQQSAYGIGKVLQFSLPLFWMWWIRREGLPLAIRNRAALCRGILFGATVGAVIPLGYRYLVQEMSAASVLCEGVRNKIAGLQLDSRARYLLMSAFYCFVHSFLEECYWRWMVFGRLRDHLSSWFANLISSLAFMAHHVLLLGYLMGWTQPLMYVFSLGVAIGGIVWAVLYERSGSLIPAWVSHLLVDAGIMAAGYLMVRPVLG